jgi:DNA-binding transcriptional regulator YiaG
MTNGAQNKIRQIRERLGLSQTEFADKIGITKGYLSSIEVANPALNPWALQRSPRLGHSGDKSARPWN